MAFVLDPNLKKYATDRQWELLTVLEEEGSERKAAERLGAARAVFWSAKQAVYKKAAIHGYAPDHDLRNPVPDGFHVKGYSLLRDAQTGEAKLIWEKAQRDGHDMQQVMRDAVDALCSEIKPLEPTDCSSAVEGSLLNLYTISDYHLGMLAWHREGGADWDLKIAENVLYKSFARMIEGAPNAKYAVVNQLGDFLHSDGLLPVTPTSGHLLDQDGRFSKIVSIAIRCLRMVVDMALEKHQYVHIIMAEGNHDLASSIWLRQMFKALYEREPRVTVNDSELPYYAYQHGETSLFFHHGHMKKMPQLGGLFAAQFPHIWGNTKHRYGHCGHLHHKIQMNEKEDMGITLVQHPTLAARDSYSSRHGWQASRRAICHTYHTKHGEVGSNVVTAEMVDEPEQPRKRNWTIVE